MTNASVTLIESQEVERDYGMRGCVAIVQHHKHGRLLLADGFGGMHTLQGGAVRWRHGLAAKLKDGDTLASLWGAEWNDAMSHMSAVMGGHDPERPVLDWTGQHVEQAAMAAGL